MAIYEPRPVAASRGLRADLIDENFRDIVEVLGGTVPHPAGGEISYPKGQLDGSNFVFSARVDNSLKTEPYSLIDIPTFHLWPTVGAETAKSWRSILGIQKLLNVFGAGARDVWRVGWWVQFSDAGATQTVNGSVGVRWKDDGTADAFYGLNGYVIGPGPAKREWFDSPGARSLLAPTTRISTKVVINSASPGGGMTAMGTVAIGVRLLIKHVP